jgi:hypothetical protein
VKPDPGPVTPTGNRALKRWGPIAGVVTAIAVGIGVAVSSGGGKDKVATTASTVAPAASTITASTTAPSSSTTAGSATSAPTAPITFPLAFAQAKEKGLTDKIDWGKRCDIAKGLLAVPDYFAQPCFAPFTGDNGGATSPGVTKDEITIVFYVGQATDPIIAYITDAVRVNDTNADRAKTMEGIVKYYEAYFELYGRKVKLISYEGTGGATDELAARADAQVVVEKYKPFVVLGGPALTSGFADELAARKVMCIGCTPNQPTDFYVSRDPYVWSLDGSAAQKQSHAVEFIKKQLVGKKAEHGGDGVKNSPRKFGLLYLQNSKASKDLADAYAKQMADSGAAFAETVAYALDPASIQATASQAISKMKAAGVTTIVFSGDPVAPRDFTKEATAQEYFPEWFVSASVLVDTNAFARTYDQQQWAHAFGVTQLAARTNPETFGYSAIYKWFNGTPAPAADSIGTIQPNAALFFAVTQAVGPNLTPATWKAALYNAPGTKAAISQPFLSWGGKLWPEPDYQGLDDATAIWWDPKATGPDEIRKQGTGMYQFVDGGKRYLAGAWPTEDKLFNPTGAVAIYDSPPPGEAPPTYPSPTK